MIALLITLAVIGLLVYLVNTYVPMAAPWKNLFNIIAIVLTVIWLLNVFGIFAYDTPLPRYHH
jgi:hypothetical protein